MNAAYRTTGRDLAAVLRALSAAPHSAHRKAEEAMERATKVCPVCDGHGTLYRGSGSYNYLEHQCPECDGTGEVAIPEPEPEPEPEPDLPESEADKRADYYAEEEDNQRYLMDLNREDA